MREKYPHLVFNTDLSGVRLSAVEAAKVKRMRTSNGFPDMVIYEAVGCWHGLFIEMKSSGQKILRQDGTLYADPHLREQAEMHRELQARGYAVCFALGIEAALMALDMYLKDQWHRAKMYTAIVTPEL